MQQTNKKRQVRRRLMTGLFCISLFAADLVSVIPAWANEPAVAAQQMTQAGEDAGEAQNPDEGKGDVQNPGGENDGNNASNPGGEGGPSQTQKPGAENDGDNAQGTDEGNNGDDASKPGEGNDGNGGNNAPTPDEGNDGDETQKPDEGNGGDETPNPGEEDGGSNTENPGGDDNITGDIENGSDASEEEGTDPEDADSVSENDSEEQEPSVSENDLGKVSLQSVTTAADDIASGSYENITWVIDANGKLTVEGSGEIRVRGTLLWSGWSKEIKSAVIKLKNTTSTLDMFAGCSNLTEVDMSEFDTSQVTDMHGMFKGCQQLKSLDISNFDTSQVTDMSWMFEGCYQLESLDISNFDTSQVTNMSYMFYDCHQLKSLDINNFDTAAVTTMQNMFYGCWGLTGLDLSGFQTDKVNNMVGMFNGCTALARLDLSSFKTANVSDMNRMFQGCKKLESLKIDRFDTSNVTNMFMMFDGCSGLKSLNVGSFNTSKVTDMGHMFNGCSGLTSLDVSNFDTGNVTNMGSMFSDCVGMDTIDLSSFDTDKVTNMGSMFYTGLIGNSGYGDGFKQLDLSSFDTGRVTNMSDMFQGQKNLIELDLSSFDTSQVTRMRCMFMHCQSLPELNLSSFDTGKVTDLIDMFYDCRALKSLDLSNFSLETHAVGTGSKELQLFAGCRNLTTLYTPYNLKEPLTCLLSSENSGDVRTIHWYDMAGTEYQYLPYLNYSILLQRDQKPAAVQGHITARKSKTAYACGEEIKLDDLTVTCYGSDGSVKKLTEGYTTNADQIDMTEAGKKKLVVTYKNGDAELTAEVTLTVTYGLTAENVTLPAETYTYDGKEKTPKPTVTYAKKKADGQTESVTLKEGTDYTVSYRNNIDANKAGAGAAAPTVIIKGTGDYSGTATKTFSIGKAAAPAPETKTVIASQCQTAKEGRTADLSKSFAAYGKKTGYAVTKVEDTNSIFSKTPVTADISSGGILTYGTNAAEEGKTAAIKVTVSFQNYNDAELTVRITMAAKKGVDISGITMADRAYNGAPASPGGTASVKAEDGKDLTGKVTLVYRYSGTMADGKAYPAQGQAAEEAPVNAGSYILTVSVDEKDKEYTGMAEYPFQIRKAEAAVRAKDLVVLMKQEGETGGDTATVPNADFGYTVSGLLGADELTKDPSYKVTTDEAGTQTITSIDRTKEGIYYIHPSGASAGMNYELSYRHGILTVSEERVVYTATLDGMGHCETATKGGIKSGSLLELTEEQRNPEAEGYLFAGWYKDKSFAKGKEWDFEKDTVQSDLTLYACWLTAAQESGLNLCVQEIPDLYYTGAAQKPAVAVYDSDGKTLLKAGKDYTVQYKNNTNVAVGADGKPVEAGGTAKVEKTGRTEKITDVIGEFNEKAPYVVITGKGNYTETIYRNFLILPADIGAQEAASAQAAGDTPLAPGFTMKYTDQLVVNKTKEQKPFGSMKYKKAMKAGTDYTVSIRAEEAEDAAGNAVPAGWEAAGTVNAKKQYVLPAIPKGCSGSFILTVAGIKNYTGTATRRVYVSEKQRLMKNASITLGKNQKTFTYTGEEVRLTPGYYDAKEKKNYKVTAQGTVSSTAEANANDMFLVKAGKNGKAGGESLVWGKDYTISYTGNTAAGTATMTLTGINGYVGSKSATFKITGAAFSTKTVEVKADGEKGFQASMPYTGRAVTQNKVKLATKATKNNLSVKELTYGEHYTITYKNNVKKGTATMTFTAKPESGYTGSFKKTFKITAQDLTADMLSKPEGAAQTQKLAVVGTDPAKNSVTVRWDEDAAHKKNGATLAFRLINPEGMPLKQGTDYTVRYKDNKAATKGSGGAAGKQPTMTVKGKGNYAGTLNVQFQITSASIETAVKEGTLAVSCTRVQQKNSMKFKDFKLKLMEGKKALGAGENKDYVVNEADCTPEKIKAYADALTAGGTLPQEPSVKVAGRGSYTGEMAIPLGAYIYAEKLDGKNTYVVVSEGKGQTIYTGEQLRPDVAVYYGDKTAVSAAKAAKETGEAALTAENGKYKLKKLTADDHTVSYGANIAAGKNKGSVTITGAGRYGGSTTVKFTIEKKAIY